MKIAISLFCNIIYTVLFKILRTQNTGFASRIRQPAEEGFDLRSPGGGGGEGGLPTSSSAAFIDLRSFSEGGGEGGLLTANLKMRGE